MYKQPIIFKDQMPNSVEDYSKLFESFDYTKITNRAQRRANGYDFRGKRTGYHHLFKQSGYATYMR
jgi:hypothetical protein